MMPIVILQPKPKGLKEFTVFDIEKRRHVKVEVLPPWESLRNHCKYFKLSPEWYIENHYGFQCRIDGEYQLLSFEQLGILGELILTEAVQ